MIASIFKSEGGTCRRLIRHCVVCNHECQQQADLNIHCVPSALLAAWTEFNSLSLSLESRVHASFHAAPKPEGCCFVLVLPLRHVSHSGCMDGVRISPSERQLLPRPSGAECQEDSSRRKRQCEPARMWHPKPFWNSDTLLAEHLKASLQIARFLWHFKYTSSIDFRQINLWYLMCDGRLAF